MTGIRIRHDTLVWPAIALVPLVDRPLYPNRKPDAEKDKCPTCLTVHLVKTVHLWLDDKGECVVSAGVFADLQTAGMPGLTPVGEVRNPPPLRIHRGRSRHEIDHENKTIRIRS